MRYSIYATQSTDKKMNRLFVLCILFGISVGLGCSQEDSQKSISEELQTELALPVITYLDIPWHSPVQKVNETLLETGWSTHDDIEDENDWLFPGRAPKKRITYRGTMFGGHDTILKTYYSDDGLLIHVCATVQSQSFRSRIQMNQKEAEATTIQLYKDTIESYRNRYSRYQHHSTLPSEMDWNVNPELLLSSITSLAGLQLKERWYIRKGGELHIQLRLSLHGTNRPTYPTKSNRFWIDIEYYSPGTDETNKFYLILH